MSSSGGPYPGFVDFSVSQGNTPGFLASIQGLNTFHRFCTSIPRPAVRDPTFGYFIEGKNISGSECELTISIQYRHGYCLYDVIKSIGIKIVSIPMELYLF